MKKCDAWLKPKGNHSAEKQWVGMAELRLFMSCMTEAWSWRRLTIHGRTTVSLYDYCTVSIKETSPLTTNEKLHWWGGRRVVYHLRKYLEFQMIEAIRISSNWRNALFDPLSLKCRKHYCDFDRSRDDGRAFRRGDLLATEKENGSTTIVDQ